MPRAGLGSAAVIERAAQLLDDNSADGLSLPALAESLGVRVPSLYKHVDGLPGLRRGVTILAKTSLSAAVGQATMGRSRDEAIAAMALAYRDWALQHPGQYPLTVIAAVPGDDEDISVSNAFLEVVFSVLAGYGLRDRDAVDATRYLRSAMHGFVALETGGGFAMPVDTDRSYARLVESLVHAFATWAQD